MAEDNELEQEIEFIDDEVEDTLEIDSDNDKDTNKPSTTVEDDNVIELDMEDDVDEDDDKDKDDNKSVEGSKKTNKDSTNTFIPFAQTLKEEGVLSDLSFKDEEGNDIEDITGEVLVNAIRNEIKKNEYADLNEDQKNILEITRNGGDVSKYLEVYQSEKNSEEQFQEITEDNAEAFTRELLKLEGTNPNRIEDIIDDRTINGTLLEKAKKEKNYFKELINKNKQKEVEVSKQQSQVQKEAQEKQLNEFKELVEKTETIIKGETLNKTTREKIFNLATQSAGVDKNGNPITAFQKSYMENPNDMEIKLNYLYAVTDGFTKMENLSRSDKAKTKAIQDLDKKLQQERNNMVGKTSTGKTNNNNKPDILSALDMFK